MNRHGSIWLSNVRKILGNQADAEDVVQEAVRRLLSRKRTLPSEDQVRMYLNRVIGNTAIDAYHARRRELQKRVPLHETMCLTGADMDPHGKMEEREDLLRQERLLHLIREGLASLPFKQYEAVRMTMLDRDTPSIRDAGVVNGIPYSTLRHRTIQGLQKLRRYVNRRSRQSP